MLAGFFYTPLDKYSPQPRLRDSGNTKGNWESGEGDGYATIIWGDKTYVPYGALDDYGERGKQIGIVDGDKDNRVYELKGYSVDEWIVNSFPYDAAMLYREIDVTDIPDGWQSEYEWNK